MITRRSLFTALAGLVGVPLVGPIIAREIELAREAEIRTRALRRAGEEAYRKMLADVPKPFVRRSAAEWYEQAARMTQQRLTKPFNELAKALDDVDDAHG